MKTRALLASLALLAVAVFPLAATAASISCTANNSGIAWNGTTASGTAQIQIYGSGDDHSVSYSVWIIANGSYIASTGGSENYDMTGNTGRVTTISLPWSCSTGVTLTVNATASFDVSTEANGIASYTPTMPKSSRILTVSGPPSAKVGTNNDYNALPSAGGGIYTWTGEGLVSSSGSHATYNWSATGNKTITATISGDPAYYDATGNAYCNVTTSDTYSVAVQVSPAAAAAAGCSASASPASGILDNGFSTLAATPAPGWQFTGWTGISGNANWTGSSFTNIFGNCTATANFTAIPPVNGSISVSPISLNEPGAATVIWSTANATSVAVSGTGLSSTAASGSQTVSGLPAGTYTYTLTAQGQGGPFTQSASFTVAPAAGVNGSISVSPSSAPKPGAMTVSWSTSNATSVSVSGTGVSSSAASGSQYVSSLAAGSYTYTLTAQGPGGPFTQTATFTVTAVGNVDGSISASPSSATEPGATTVSWSTSNATSVSVSGNGVSSSTANGSQYVSGLAAGSYTYTLTAQGAGGPITRTTTFTVAPPAPPSVNGSISVSPASAAAPGATTVSWNTTNATSVSVSGNGVNSSAASGSQYVSGLAAGAYTFTLTAQGQGGPITRTATFTVSSAAGMVSGSITANPANATAPGSTTISWNTSNASSVMVSGNGVLSMAYSGSKTVTGLPAGSYTYTLTAEGSGGPINQTVTFTVLPGSGLASIVIPPLPTVRGYNSPPTYASYVDYVRINTPTPASSVSMTVIAPNGMTLTPSVRNCQPDNNPSWYAIQSPWTIGNINKDMYYEPTIPPFTTAGTYKLQVTVTNSAGTVTAEATGQAVLYAMVYPLFNVIGAEVSTDTGTTDDDGNEIYLTSPQDYGWSLNPPGASYALSGDKINYTVTQGTVYRFLYWSDFHGILSYNPNFTYTSNGLTETLYANVTAVAPTALTVTLSGSKPYDGATPATGATAAITAGSLNSGDTISYSYAATPSANVGSYPALVTATVRNASNADVTYNYAISYTGGYTITPAAQTVTLLPATATLIAGNSQIFTAAGGHNAYTWGGSASGTGVSQNVPFPTAGTYTVTVQSAAGGNYAASNVATATIAVNPAAPTLALSLTPLVSNYTVNDASSPLNGKTYKRVWQDGGAWHAYLGRSGDQFQIVGQATAAVQSFELQALEPNADPSAWYSLATIAPPTGVPNGPGVSVTGVFSVSLDSGSAAAALVPQSYAQGHPKTGVWQLRARTQDSSGTWSDWSNIVAVTVDLPLTTKTVTAQSLPPAGPIGGWFTASDQATFNLPVWIP